MSNYLGLIFEAAVVKRLQRTGWQILGDNRETVGEHTFMTAVISYVLYLEISKKQRLNPEKILLMSIFHDFHESRTGEVDKIALQYIKRDEAKANRDIFKNKTELLNIVDEYEDKKSVAARLVYEANILALLVELKVLKENGNIHADEWLEGNYSRLRLPEAVKLGKEIISGNSQSWWKDIRVKLRSEFKK